MKALLVTLAVIAANFSIAARTRACDPAKPSSPHSTVQPGSQPPRVPTPLPQRSNQPSGSPTASSRLDADWDLPNDPASRTKAPPARSEPVASPGPAGQQAPTAGREQTAQIPAGLSERLMQAGAARQTVMATIKRLETKREELARWDSEAQAKFQRVFGTTDENLRKRVLDRLDVEIANNQKVVEQITDNMAMQLYILSKRKK